MLLGCSLLLLPSVLVSAAFVVVSVMWQLLKQPVVAVLEVALLKCFDVEEPRRVALVKARAARGGLSLSGAACSHMLLQSTACCLGVVARC